MQRENKGIPCVISATKVLEKFGGLRLASSLAMSLLTKADPFQAQMR